MTTDVAAGDSEAEPKESEAKRVEHFTVRERAARGRAARAEVPRSTLRDFCASELARSHARSGDAVAIAGYLGTSERFDGALAAFAELYADQNECDYGVLQDAVRDGRIKAESGV